MIKNLNVCVYMSSPGHAVCVSPVCVLCVILRA